MIPSHTLTSFSKARLHMSALYTFVLFCIVFVFSVSLFFARNNDYRKFALQQDFGKAVPRKLTLFQKRVLTRQVIDLRRSFLYELLLIDGTMLLVGGVLSYFFAGRTLKPVQEALENQENFIADASHELRTPLAAIQTAIEVVLRKEQKSPEIYKETLADVQDEVGRMHNLLEELLLLSRIDMNELSVSLSSISLTEVVLRTAKEMKPLIQKKGLHLQETFNEKVVVMGDEERVKQLLLILLDNAIKYTPKGGEITISVHSSPQPSVVISDTGKGIASEKQQDIFKRFYQADRSHTGLGAGLGLSIAEAIMELHKGKITVESTLGKGSTFTCSFPRISRPNKL